MVRVARCADDKLVATAALHAGVVVLSRPRSPSDAAVESSGRTTIVVRRNDGQVAIQILSVYGLRPEELRYLVVQDGKLKTTYQKSKGGTKGERTSTRFLFPLFGELKEAKHYNWNLKERLIKKEALPEIKNSAFYEFKGE